MNDDILALKEFEDAKNYWLDKLSGEIKGTGLIEDFKSTVEYEDKVYKITLDRELSLKLYEICKGHDLTLFVIMLSVFKVVLYKYTNCKDTIVSTPVYSENNECCEFNNWVVMRDWLDYDMSFKEVLESVQKTVLDAYKNQHYPYEELFEFLKVEDRSLILKTLFFSDRIHNKIENLNEISKNCIELSYNMIDDNIQISSRYNAKLFRQWTIEKLLDRYWCVLRQVVYDSSIKIGDLNILIEDEERSILFDFNNSDVKYSSDKTVHRLFEEQVKRFPDNTAVVFGEEKLTYRELDKKANQLANYLKSEFKIEQENLVGVFMEQSVDRLITPLAILKAGGAFIPIDAVYPEERIQTIINDAKISIVVSTKRHIRILNRLQWACKSFKEYICMDSDDIYAEKEVEKNELMDEKLWEFVGDNSEDDIEGGGWTSSYTGESLSEKEMEEYSDNVFQKLKPYLNKDTRVLEIGCASGLSMFKISPFVSLYYGTDLSSVIIEKDRERVLQEGLENIVLEALSANDIDKIGEKGFDIVILNSVIQCFHGHNYLRSVIKKAIDLINDEGILFIGDVMDLDLKEDLIKSLIAFQGENSNKDLKTKIDFSAELFVSRSYFEDLGEDIPEIKSVEFSEKIFTIENELTKFRYDTVVKIHKTSNGEKRYLKKHKKQLDRRMLLNYNESQPENDIYPDNLAYVIYTSGTTGTPNGVMIEHHSLVNLCEWHKEYFEISHTDIATHYAGFSFDASVWEIFPYLTAGACVHVIPEEIRLDMEKLNAYYEKNNITLSFLPTQICEKFMQFENKSLKKLLTGGDKLKHYVNTNYQIINNYGPTENTVVTCGFLLDKEYDNIPIGKPIWNTKIYIIDEKSKLQPIGLPGELCISGAGLARGYLNSPQLKEKKFVQNPFTPSEVMYKTGDLARWLPDGNIEFLGRLDHQVKIRGYRIELGEIEARLLNHSQIEEAVVVCRYDSEGNNYLCAYIVCDLLLTIQDIKEYLLRKMPDYMVPTHFMQIDKIPLNSNGKVDKKALPIPTDGIIEAKYVAPTNDIESKLASMWQDILKIDRVGINDNFFELGGHSLKAITLVSKIRKELIVEVPLSEMFKCTNLKELAEYIRAIDQDNHSIISPIEEKEYYAVSSAQRRMFILDRLEKESITYNLPIFRILEGELDKSWLEEVFYKLINRHESLRTTFHLMHGEPVQKIHESVEFKISFYGANETQVEEVIDNFVKPFNLESAPLLRVGLIKMEKDKHLFMFDMHHIVSDGVSMNILVNELISLYEKKELSALKIQYKDFTAWHNKFLESGGIANQEEFWMEVFKGEIPKLNFPTDYPRPPIQTFEGSKVVFELENNLTELLNKYAKDTGATLYMVLFAAFNILLYNYTSQEDIIVGSPTAGRTHSDLENIVGMFVNTIVMRNYPTGNKSFKQFLDEVKSNCIMAFENQDYQFEMLIDKLDLQKDLSRNPLFDVFFAFENMELIDLKLGDLKISSYEYENKISKFDFILFTYESKKGVLFELEYNTNLFKRESMEKMLKHYYTIINQILNNPEIKLCDIEIITEDEKKEIVFDFNNTDILYKDNNTIHKLFEEQVKKTPNNTAIIFEETRITYRELNNKANKLARNLQRNGIGCESIVGIMLQKSTDMIICLLAVLKAGGAYLPIDPKYPQERIYHMLRDSGAVMLLTDSYSRQDIPFTSLQNIESNNKEIILTPMREHIKDFDNIPIPNRNLIDVSKYKGKIGMASVTDSISLQTTRGCPYLCLFCHKVWSKNHVLRSAENIYNEIKYYYNNGVRNFSVIDDCFNLNAENGKRLFKMIINSGMKVQIFFPNGLRGDILTYDYIDLMVEAGVVNINLSLETASNRLQKLIKKHLDLDKLRSVMDYIAGQYPNVILELATMHGFPTETQEEAMMTLNFIKDTKWIHFPYIHILKVFPNTEMEELALKNGVKKEDILKSVNLAYHEIPETLPYPKRFTRQYQSQFLNEYFLSKERLKHVLPVQMKVLSEEALLQKYNAYLPMEVKSIQDILDAGGIDSVEELNLKPKVEKIDLVSIFDIENKRIECLKSARRIMFIDLSQHFSSQSMLYKVFEQPLGQMYILTYLKEKFGNDIDGRIYKSGIDFDSFEELKKIIDEYKPEMIGIRTLSFYKQFFHETVSLLRQWGFEGTIISGGPYATSDYTYILQDKNVDLVILGEGEYTFAEVVKHMLKDDFKLPDDEILSNIKGVAFARNNQEDKSVKVMLIDNDMNCEEELEDDLSNINTKDNLAYIMYTSGSTGKPKGVMVEHKNVNNCIKWMQSELCLSKEDIVLQRTNLTFDPSVWEVFWPLYTGAALKLLTENQGKDTEYLIDLMTNNQELKTMYCPASLVSGITYMLESKNYNCKLSLPWLIIGAEPISKDIIKKFYNYFNGRIVNTYGPTECTINNTYYHIGRDDNRAIIPIGKPVANNKIYILSKDLKILPIGIPGQIYISGDSVARGYINDLEKTAESFIDNPFGTGIIYKTGDVGKWLTDGNVEILGRLDNQIKLRGYRIELGEIEDALKRIEHVKECAVVVKDNKSISKSIKVCKICGITSKYPDIQIDEDNTCSLCNEISTYRRAISKYFKTINDLDMVIKDVKRTSTYDCMLLYAGGKGAAYSLYRLAEMGYNVLTVTYDNGYFSEKELQNIKRITNNLGMDHVILTHENSSQILKESLESAGTVCKGCFFTSSALALDYAYQNKIKIVIGATLSQGQIIENKLYKLIKQGITDVDEIENELSKLQRFTFDMNENIYKYIDLEVVQNEEIYEAVKVIDFYRYCDITNEEMIRYLIEKDPYWNGKKNYAIYSTNCPIKQIGDYSYLKEKDYHYYGSAISWEKRLGHITLDNVNEDLQCNVTEKNFNIFANKIGYEIKDKKLKELDARYICAYIVNDGEQSVAKIREELSKSLAEYMIPSQFVALETMPYTNEGKIDRKALPEPVGYINIGSKYVMPENEVQQKIADVWQEILGIEKVGIKDNFFEIGGDSIKAIQISARIQNYNLTMKIQDLFSNPTIEGLYKYVKYCDEKADQGMVIGEVLLSPIQKYFFEKNIKDMHHWNQSIMLQGRNGFDESSIRHVFAKLVQHHDALRMAFKFDNGNIIQYYREFTDNIFVLETFNIKGKTQYKKEIYEISDKLQASLNIEEGPIIRLGLFNTDVGDYLLLIIHHLVVDGISWRILLDDFAIALKQVLDGNDIRLPSKTQSFQKWSKELRTYANSHSLIKEISYWKQVVGRKITNLPKDNDLTDNLTKDSNHIRVEFSEDITNKLLTKINHIYNTEINDVLLSALILAFYQWQGIEELPISLEGHGREDLNDDTNISRTVGWFTSIYPIILEISEDDSIASQLHKTKEILRKVPNKGAGYSILKYISQPVNKVFESDIEPEICFNYLGQFDQEMLTDMFMIEDILLNSLNSPFSERTHNLEFSGVITNSRLKITCRYSMKQYERSSIIYMMSKYKENLEKIIDYCLLQKKSIKTATDFLVNGVELEDVQQIFEEFV